MSGGQFPPVAGATGTVAFSSAGPTPMSFRVRRSTFYMLPGAIAGFLWLLPVFVPPGAATDAGGFSVARVARVLSIALLLPLVAGRLPALFIRQRPVTWALLAFVLLPAVSAINHPSFGFIVGVVGPYMIGGVSLLCLAALRPRAFERWTEGVGIVAAGFVAVGLLQHGLEMTSYYGRPRAHLGFVHPIQTASAVLFAAYSLARLSAALPDSVRRLRRIATVAIWGGTVALLVLVSSRNALLLFCTILMAAAYSRLARGTFARLALVIVILALFPAIMAFAHEVSPQEPLWMLLNFVSSYRLTFYSAMVENFVRSDWATMLFGPTSVVRNRAAGAQGFAVADSVYLSILLNYGAVTLLAFYAFWLALARRLSRRNGAIAYGMLCGVSVYFLLDAQGATPSNILVFTLVAQAVRSSLRVAGPSEVPALADAASPEDGPGEPSRAPS
jgi:hypothetical protein